MISPESWLRVRITDSLRDLQVIPVPCGVDQLKDYTK
jgi:hypothetical protein